MNSVSPLADLIEECRAAFLDRNGVGLNYSDIARRSGKRELTRTRVHQLATKPIKALPGADTLQGLALGLGVPYSVVLERALVSAGYVVQTSPNQQQKETG